MKPLLLPSVIASLLIATTSVEGADFAYTVAPGDTLSGIAQRYLRKSADWRGLQEFNHIADPRQLPVGGRILIPRQWLRVDVVPARLIRVQGTVSRSGQPVQTGGEIHSGDELSTGADGYVTLVLADGSRLVLQPNSRLGLERMQRSRGLGVFRTRLKLFSGRLDNEVAKQSREGGYQVDTPAALIAVRGTGFRVAAEASRSLAEVTEGVVAAGRRSARLQPLRAGEGMVLAADGRPTPQLLLPAPGWTPLPEPWEKTILRFALPAAEGVAAYRVQLARDRNFDQLLADLRQGPGDVRIADVPDGELWLRVRGISIQGLEGLDRTVSVSVRARPEAPLLTKPSADARVFGNQVELGWTAASGASAYRLLLLDGRGEVLRQTDQPDPGATLADLGPGEYRWQVASLGADGKAGPWGEGRGFSVRPPQSAPTMVAATGDNLNFSWSGESGQKYELELDRDGSFVAPLAKVSLDKAAWTLPRPDVGRYYLRIRSIDPDGFVGPWSANQSFEVPARPWWLLLGLLPLLL